MGVPVKMLFLYCYGCGRLFGLAAGTGKLRADTLPDPFRATCPHCKKTRIVRKSEITNKAVRPDVAMID